MDFVFFLANYTRTPGAHYQEQGPRSAQQWYEDVIFPKLKSRCPVSNPNLILNLDDVEGFSTAYIAEVLSGFLRDYPKGEVAIVCHDEPSIIQRVQDQVLPDIRSSNREKK